MLIAMSMQRHVFPIPGDPQRMLKDPEGRRPETTNFGVENSRVSNSSASMMDAIYITSPSAARVIKVAITRALLTAPKGWARSLSSAAISCGVRTTHMGIFVVDGMFHRVPPEN